ncbi:unnamed protein product, partial [Prunus brigantina]
YKNSWLDNGIYHAITYSTIQLQADSPLLGSALMFWNNASNTFDFGVGSMLISILDLARKKSIETLFGIIVSSRAYEAFMMDFMNKEVDYTHGEHIMFLVLAEHIHISQCLQLYYNGVAPTSKGSGHL